MSNKKMGFATMTQKRIAEIASQGGKAAHAKGTAHQWTSEEATIAGRIGGKKTQENNKLRKDEKTG